MNKEGFQRKLTAILSADVVGYSLLMQDNEEVTVRTLNNWWGSGEPDQNRIVGPVAIEPVLEKPIDLPKIKELRF